MTDIGKPLYAKYTVYRNDGKDEPGGEKEDARYFVLDYAHDPFARKALAAYVDAILTQANAHRYQDDPYWRGEHPYVPPLAGSLMHELMDTESPDHAQKAKELVRTWIAKEHMGRKGEMNA